MISLRELADQPALTISMLHHREMDCLAFRIDGDQELFKQVKQLPGILYTKTHRCYYLPDNDANRRLLLKQFKGRAQMDFLSAEKAVTISAHSAILKEYEDMLICKRYSGATLKNYMSQLGLFLNYFNDTPIEEIKEEQIKSYMKYLTVGKKVSTSTHNMAINAIKFYFEIVKGNASTRYSVERPLKESKLPLVLSEEEVRIVES